jgi:hypothetical protein
MKSNRNSMVGHVELSGARAPGEVHFKLRLPLTTVLKSVTVNGEPARRAGTQRDTVIIATKGEKRFEVIGQLG